MPTPSSLIGEIDGRDGCDADSDRKIRVPARVWGREEKLKKLKEGGGGVEIGEESSACSWMAGREVNGGSVRDQVTKGQRSRERETESQSKLFDSLCSDFFFF